MRRLLSLMLLSLVFVFPPLFSQGLIIDHECTDVSLIPDTWVERVRANIKFHYCHTSHGQQLIEGLRRLANPSLPAFDPRLRFIVTNYSLPSNPDLCIMNGQSNGVAGIFAEGYWKDGGDLITRASLNANPGVNVSMFMWCRDLDHYSQAQVADYLETMAELEKAFPQVIFVYATGNAESMGEAGYNRHLRNEQIREFCRENNKVLYDFGDLDAWYDNEEATYLYDGQKIPVEHPFYGTEEICQHTTYASCENKGRALWWLLAKTAGWRSSACDLNRDGQVDWNDFLIKRAQVVMEYRTWLRESRRMGGSRVDWDDDGIVDDMDGERKQRSLVNELITWLEECLPVAEHGSGLTLRPGTKAALPDKNGIPRKQTP